VNLKALRNYLKAFAGAAYQNPQGLFDLTYAL